MKQSKPASTLTMKKRIRTSLLTPLQVKEAIITWARANGLLEMEDDVEYPNVSLRVNGSAAIKIVTETKR